MDGEPYVLDTCGLDDGNEDKLPFGDSELDWDESYTANYTSSHTAKKINAPHQSTLGGSYMHHDEHGGSNTSELQRLRDEVMQLKHERALWKETRGEIEDALNAAEREAETSFSRISTLQKEVRKHQELVSRTTTARAELEDEVSVLQTKLEQVMAEKVRQQQHTAIARRARKNSDRGKRVSTGSTESAAVIAKTPGASDVPEVVLPLAAAKAREGNSNKDNCEPVSAAASLSTSGDVQSCASDAQIVTEDARAQSESAGEDCTKADVPPQLDDSGTQSQCTTDEGEETSDESSEVLAAEALEHVRSLYERELELLRQHYQDELDEREAQLEALRMSTQSSARSSIDMEVAPPDLGNESLDQSLASVFANTDDAEEDFESQPHAVSTPRRDMATSMTPVDDDTFFDCESATDEENDVESNASGLSTQQMLEHEVEDRVLHSLREFGGCTINVLWERLGAGLATTHLEGHAVVTSAGVGHHLLRTVLFTLESRDLLLVQIDESGDVPECKYYASYR
eukprot:m.199027 g.199027  ORF g.199027 m.199027 type:complete len:515 (+) comp18771_c0_seq1:461-2005(+)